MAGWGRRFVDFLLPPACAGCGNHIPLVPAAGGPATRSRPRVCIHCRTRLKPLPNPRCSRCHAPRGTGLPADRPCTECEDWPEVLRSARSAAILAPPADALIHALKYGGWPELGGELAAWMMHLPSIAGAAVEGRPLVPVPTTSGRLRRRGYNQARVLAEGVARRTGAPVVDALERRSEGASQIALHPGERRANVSGAFSFREAEERAVRGTDVLLVDDVLTTGATASAAAAALGDGGARSVTLVTFARALPGLEMGNDRS